MTTVDVLGILFAVFAATFAVQLVVRTAWSLASPKARAERRELGVTVRVRRTNPLPGGVPLHAHARPADGEGLRLDESLVTEVKAKLDEIPPIPIVVQRLIQEIANPRSSARTVSRIAQTDPVLAATFLKVVNSAYYGLRHPVTSLDQAVAMLGYRTIHSLVMHYGFARIFGSGGDRKVYRTEDLWVHSLAVSLAAQALAKNVEGVDVGFVATLGLLHDIGKLVIATKYPKQIEEAWEQAAAAGKTYLARERDLFGADHTQLGAHLARQWGLPENLATAIRLHHAPHHPEVETLAPGERRALGVVHVANQLVKFCHAYCEDVEVDLVPDEHLQALGLEPPLEGLLGGAVREAITRAIHFVDSVTPQPLQAVQRLVGVRTARELGGKKSIPSSWMNDPVLARIAIGPMPTLPYLQGLPSLEFDLEAGDALAARRLAFSGTPDLTLRFEPSLERMKAVLDFLGPALETMGYGGDVRFSVRFLVKVLLGNVLAARSGERRVEVRLRRGLEHDYLLLASAGLAFRNLAPVDRLRDERGPDFARQVCRALLGAGLGRTLTLGWYDEIESNDEGDRILFIRGPALTQPPPSGRRTARYQRPLS